MKWNPGSLRRLGLCGKGCRHISSLGDVNAKQIWIDKTVINDCICLTFTDNGNGMTSDKLHKMLRYVKASHSLKSLLLTSWSVSCAILTACSSCFLNMKCCTHSVLCSLGLPSSFTAVTLLGNPGHSHHPSHALTYLKFYRPFRVVAQCPLLFVLS